MDTLCVRMSTEYGVSGNLTWERKGSGKHRRSGRRRGGESERKPNGEKMESALVHLFPKRVQVAIIVAWITAPDAIEQWASSKEPDRTLAG